MIKFRGGKNVREIGIGYGALMPSIKEQAEKQGYILDEKKAENFEKLRESISWLTFGGILTDSQINMAYQKLHKKVIKSLRPLVGD